MVVVVGCKGFWAKKKGGGNKIDGGNGDRKELAVLEDLAHNEGGIASVFAKEDSQRSNPSGPTSLETSALPPPQATPGLPTHAARRGSRGWSRRWLLCGAGCGLRGEKPAITPRSMITI